MAISAYQVTGVTHKITATSTSAQISITPSEAGIGFSGQTGPYFLKITNGSVDQNIYFSVGLTSQTAVIPTGDGVLAGSTPIPAFAEVIIQVAPQSAAPAEIFVAAVASSSSPVFITPVAVVA